MFFASLRMVIDSLDIEEVSFFFFGVLGDVQMSLDPWLRCEEHDECA